MRGWTTIYFLGRPLSSACCRPLTRIMWSDWQQGGSDRPQDRRHNGVGFSLPAKRIDSYYAVTWFICWKLPTCNCTQLLLRSERVFYNNHERWEKNLWVKSKVTAHWVVFLQKQYIFFYLLLWCIVGTCSNSNMKKCCLIFFPCCLL